jgi:hypothetical protein
VLLDKILIMSGVEDEVVRRLRDCCIVLPETISYTALTVRSSENEI